MLMVYVRRCTHLSHDPSQQPLIVCKDIVDRYRSVTKTADIKMTGLDILTTTYFNHNPGQFSRQTSMLIYSIALLSRCTNAFGRHPHFWYIYLPCSGTVWKLLNSRRHLYPLFADAAKVKCIWNQQMAMNEKCFIATMTYLLLQMGHGEDDFRHCLMFKCFQQWPGYVEFFKKNVVTKVVQLTAWLIRCNYG